MKAGDRVRIRKDVTTNFPEQLLTAIGHITEVRDQPEGQVISVLFPAEHAYAPDCDARQFEVVGSKPIDYGGE